MATSIQLITSGGTSSFTLTTGGRGPQGPPGTNGGAWNDLTGTADVVPFTTTNGGPQEIGELAWDQAEETLSLGLPHGTILQLGEEVLYHVENNTGSTIPDGTPVSYAGTVGSSGKIRVKPWNGSTDSPLIFMGIATSEILHEGAGYVTHFGKVRGINTSAFSANSILYANPSGTGLTATQPTSGQYVIAALVINSANNGTLFVRPRTFGGANWDAINGKPSFGTAALADTSEGGNGSGDSGKVAAYNDGGSLGCSGVNVAGINSIAVIANNNSVLWQVPILNMPAVDGTYVFAKTSNTDGVPDAIANLASFTAANNATFSYGNSTARDNHLTALGGSTVGQAVFKAADAAAARAALDVQRKITTSDVSRNNTTVYTDDATLAGFTVESNTWYMVEFCLLYTCTINGGIKLQFNHPSLASSSSFSGRLFSPSTPVDIVSNNATITTLMSQLASRTVAAMTGYFRCRIGNSAGTLALQWAQQTSNADNTTIHEGSLLTVTKL